MYEQESCIKDTFEPLPLYIDIEPMPIIQEIEPEKPYITIIDIF